MIKLAAVRHVNEYVIWLRFTDGTEGEVDLRAELYGEVFEPLKNLDVFKTFFVNPEWGTIAWPNGARPGPGVSVLRGDGSCLISQLHKPSNQSERDD